MSSDNGKASASRPSQWPGHDARGRELRGGRALPTARVAGAHSGGSSTPSVSYRTCGLVPDTSMIAGSRWYTRQFREVRDRQRARRTCMTMST
jgi:hypothetical protein